MKDQLHATYALPPGTVSGTRWMGGWLCFTAGLGALKKIKISCPFREWNHDFLVLYPVIYNFVGTRSFPGVKRPGRRVDHPPTSSAEVKERIELYLYSPSGPSWLVLGRTLPLPIILSTNYVFFKFWFGETAARHPPCVRPCTSETLY